MWQIGTRGSSARIGRRAAMLVMVALFGMMLAPALAAAMALPATTPAPPAPVNTAAPTLTGTPALGQTLTCSTGTWANSPTSFSYTWLRSGVPIAGQAGGTYVVQPADQGHTISCQVTAANGGGNYTISGLATGSYKVDFFSEEGANYLTQYFSGKPSLKEANTVSVTVPATTVNVNAEMHVGGQISGRVTSAATHGAMANVEVCAGEGGAELFGGCASTNGNGEYTISGLASGSYVVEFFSFFEEGNFLPQYYSGKASASEANHVGVTAGSTTPNINAELQAGGGISGKVTDMSLHPLANIEVCAKETTNNFYGGCASTNGSGEYTIVGLPSSSYSVEFYSNAEGVNYLAQYWNNKASVGEAESVVVSAPGTTTGINAEMHVAGEISGTVTDASTHARLAKIEACALGSSGYLSSCAATNSNGEYTIAGLSEGAYKVQFFAGYEGGDYLFQYWSGKPTLAEAESVSVTLGKTHEGIDAEMHSGGEIAGRVTDASSTHVPLEKVEVCAEEGGGNLNGGCVSTNANGEYTISRLETGSYSLELRDFKEGVNYLPQTVSGVSVIAPNMTAPINAELHPGAQISGRVTDATTHAGLVGIEVCAAPEAKGVIGNCARTTAGAASANASSNALIVPAGNFTLTKASFDSKTNELDFFFMFPTAGTLKWSLFFNNADVGFADSLGLSLKANGVAAGDGSAQALAEAARKKKKIKGCKRGTVRHHRKCVHVLVPFGSGSQSVLAGIVEVKVHASSRAIKALKSGRTLHVSGTFTFQSALGGPPIAKNESVVVRLSKKHARKHGKGKRH